MVRHATITDVKRIFLLAVCTGSLVAADRARVDAIAERMREQIVKFDARMAKDPTPTMRDVTNCALAKLALNGDAKGAESLLRFFFEQQDMDAASATYGDVHWQVGHPEIKDANAIEFTSQPHRIAFFAAFLHRIGSMKTALADWKDLFWETAYNQKGD